VTEPAPRPPPGPPRAVARTLVALARDRLGTLERLKREHGDVVAFDLLKTRVVLVSHPDDVRDVLATHATRYAKSGSIAAAGKVLGEGLVTSEGAKHRRHKRMIAPVFNHARVADLVPFLAQEAGAARDGRFADGTVVDVDREMTRLALRSVARTLFGLEMDEGDAAEILEALNRVVEVFEFAFLPFPDVVEWIPFPPIVRFRLARRRLDRAVRSMVAARRAALAAGRSPSDLLDLLLTATDEAGGPGFDDTEVRDEVVTLLLAGAETTARALAWTWWQLAANAEAESRLHAEVDALGGRAPTAAETRALPWTRAVLSESMRLMPPVWILGREALEDHAIGGYAVPRGATVAVSQWLVHRDPRWWGDDALAFDPARFLAPAPERPRFAYFPFGGGPRVCVGEGYAWTAGVVALATLAQRLRFERPADAAAPRLKPGVSLRPKGGLPMRVAARSID